MSNPKVLLLELKERTSASGNRYMSGWLGKASVVAFLDRDAAEPTWQVFVQTPDPKPGQERQPSRSASVRPGGDQSWRRDIPPQSAPGGRGKRPVRAGQLDDDIGDIGR